MNRFVEARGQNGEVFVVDLKGDQARILCSCTGFKAPLNASYICEALEAYHDHLYDLLKVEKA